MGEKRNGEDEERSRGAGEEMRRGGEEPGSRSKQAVVGRRSREDRMTC